MKTLEEEQEQKEEEQVEEGEVQVAARSFQGLFHTSDLAGKTLRLFSL